MKKTYINPEMIVVTVQTPALLADSLTVNMDSEEEITTAEAILSRQSSVWDDDEEDF